ncbi:MAG: hypothetical protein KC996_05440 [Phycisphaerales bacterium]|nr:hypothetical protein [Phycisphaerales bacterium]
MSRESSKVRRGGSLIEVMAAVALLGGIFASSLRATAGMVRQHRASIEKTQAVEELEQLLTQWTLAGGVPLDAEGETTKPAWRWRSESTRDLLGDFVIRRVSIAIFASEDQIVLASCELLVAEEQPGIENGTRDGDQAP